MDLGFRDGIDFRGYPGFMDQRLYGAIWGAGSIAVIQGSG